MKNISTYILILCVLFSCKKDDEITNTPNSNSHIKNFGFTLIDTYWDDPTDAETKTNYADEVHSFSNLADILVLTPTDNIISRVENFSTLDMKAILHLSELFFEQIDANSPSGINYGLREDYIQRWTQFTSVNSSILTTNHIAAFYIGEEPTWNGISFTELELIASLIKADFPNIPIMLVEAYPALNDLQIPEQVDWVGFDRYFIENPVNDIEFQKDWQMLKSKLSNSTQRIIVIMDTHYIDWAHGDYGNIALDNMDEVANNYYDLAKSDQLVIGILGYFWPNGFDNPESIGARGMPNHVGAEYERIGKEITGKY